MLESSLSLKRGCGGKGVVWRQGGREGGRLRAQPAPENIDSAASAWYALCVLVCSWGRVAVSFSKVVVAMSEHTQSS